MMTVTATFDLTILYFVAANVVGILVYLLWRRRQSRFTTRQLAVVTAAVHDFFRENEEKVTVECVQAADGKGFVALIASPPTKRLRHSHIVAEFLCNHVRKATGIELARVFWRFPIKAKQALAIAAETDVDAASPGEVAAEYLEQGRKLRRDAPEYEVAETTWEQYEELCAVKAAIAHPARTEAQRKAA